MSYSSLALTPEWRDYWGAWNPQVEVTLREIEKSKCHAPRVALVPSLDACVVPNSGQIRYNFDLVSGSLIYGVMAGNFVFQLSDLNLGHQLFQAPIAGKNSVKVTGNFQGVMQDFFLLPCAWPVVGDGLFSFETWGSPGDLNFIYLLLAEVSSCPVRS